jgi:hypothetical protein
VSEGWGGPPAQPQYQAPPQYPQQPPAAPQAPQQQWAPPAPQQQYPQPQGGWGPQPPAQQWGPPPEQQQWGAPQQQAPQGPVAEPPPAEDFFTGSGGAGDGGPFAPSFKFDWNPQANQGTAVRGEVVFRVQKPKTDTGSTVQKVDSLGRPRWQLKVTLQTPLRNWQGVSQVPTDKLPSGQEIPWPPDRDTGLRNVYLDYKSRDAVQEAMQAAGADLAKGVEVGAILGLRVIGTEKNTKGPQPIKLYDAVYTPPGAAPAAPPAQIAPPAQQQPQYAPPAPQGPPQGYPPAQPQYGPPPGQQPGWGAPQQQAPYSQEPPF